MIKTLSEIPAQVVEESGNVSGRIVKNYVLTPEEMGSRARMFARIDLPAGSMILEHAHSADAEVYYVLEGEVTVTDNAEVRVLYPGDVLFTADGNRHSIANRGLAPAAFLAVILNNK